MCWVVDAFWFGIITVARGKQDSKCCMWWVVDTGIIIRGTGVHGENMRGWVIKRSAGRPSWLFCVRSQQIGMIVCRGQRIIIVGIIRFMHGRETR